MFLQIVQLGHNQLGITIDARATSAAHSHNNAIDNLSRGTNKTRNPHIVPMSRHIRLGASVAMLPPTKRQHASDIVTM